MKTVKEKPKGTKTKAEKGKSAKRSQPAISAKQAAKLMRDKYIQQLDQRKAETSSVEAQAVEQVEQAGAWAVDELLIHEHPRAPHQRGEKIKERPQAAPESADQPVPTSPVIDRIDQPVPPPPTMGHMDQPTPTPSTPEKAGRPISAHAARAIDGSSPPVAETGYRPLYRERISSLDQHTPPIPKERPMQPDGTYRPAEAPPTKHSPATMPPEKKAKLIKERSAHKIKEKRTQTAVPSIKERSAPLSDPIGSIASIHPSTQRPALPKEPAIRSTAPGQRTEGSVQPKVGAVNAPPQRAPAVRQADVKGLYQPTQVLRPPADQTPPSGIPVSRPAPLAQRAGQNTPNDPRQNRTPSAHKKRAGPQQIAQGTVSPSVSAGQKLTKTYSSTKGTIPKIRGVFYPKDRSAPKLSRPLSKTTVAGKPRTARHTVQRRMVQRTIQRLKTATKASASVVKKTAEIATKAAAALINSVAVLAGGGILLLALVAVVIVAAVAGSPFGLFFTQEQNAPGTVSVAQAIGSVKMAYNSRLELLQAGDYDDIVVQGQAPDMVDVLAVFAVKTAGADVDSLDVATLDLDWVDKLTAVFWDMTEITLSEETIDHPASGSDEAWTEKILHITVTPKTADDMRMTYAFSEYQNSALDELLSDRSALASMAGSLTITSTDVRDVLTSLPASLDQARQDTVQTALQLVGKVNYFWGGKSRVIGWDSRWGELEKVTASGSSTTGTYRPFGLDCSGFVDWTFNNSLGYIIGHGGGARAQHTYCTNISQSAAQPGDLAFYPDDSHVGIIVGRNGAGKLLVCHCSSGKNNVVVTEFSASGFTAVGRPDIFSP